MKNKNKNMKKNKENLRELWDIIEHIPYIYICIKWELYKKRRRDRGTNII